MSMSTITTNTKVTEGAFTELVNKAKKLYSSKFKIIGFASILIAVVATVFIYCLYRLGDVIQRYRETIQNDASRRQEAMASGKGTLLDPSNDNNEYSSNAEDTSGEKDEYTQITQTIRKKFSEYQNYNKSLDEHYRTTRKTTAPDVIDQTSMVASNDNW